MKNESPCDDSWLLLEECLFAACMSWEASASFEAGFGLSAVPIAGGPSEKSEGMRLAKADMDEGDVVAIRDMGAGF